MFREIDPMVWCAAFGAAFAVYPQKNADGVLSDPERWARNRLDYATREADAAVEALHPHCGLG